MTSARIESITSDREIIFLQILKHFGGIDLDKFCAMLEVGKKKLKRQGGEEEEEEEERQRKKKRGKRERREKK